jgi:acyl carrier protein
MLVAELNLVDELPLTANGKVDRNALLRLAPQQPESKHVPPRTDLERTIADTCAAVLGIERIGVEDDFFERGGHSLLATQVIARLRGELEIDLQLRWLFEARTVAALAARIEDAGDELSLPAEQAILPVARELVALPSDPDLLAAEEAG